MDDINRLQTLSDAIDATTNDDLLNYTTAKIKELNVRVISELYLSPQAEKEMVKKLNSYRYIDDIRHLTIGSYIRWIPVEDPDNLFLATGAIFCEIHPNTAYLVCKNVYNTRFDFFQVDPEKVLVFQKLTNQEIILLSALDYVADSQD